MANMYSLDPQLGHLDKFIQNQGIFIKMNKTLETSDGKYRLYKFREFGPIRDHQLRDCPD